MKYVWVLAFGLGAASLARAEPVVTIRNNGPAENRLNFVIVGDGYTAGDLVKYSTDVDLLVQRMFEQSPYAEYARYFNVLRVDVTSNQSGASHPETGVTRDTAFGAAYNCGGIQRTICVNTASVNAVVARSVPPEARDLILVLVNDSQYGGSGGSVIVGSTAAQVVELVLHEMGHTLGLLGDEYSDSPPACINTTEPAQVNIARDIGRQSIKWASWIDPSTSLPTPGTAAAVPGAYEGANYCVSGLYRPTYNSKMRSLGNPFDQVNTEQLILRIYNFVLPYDSASPSDASVTSTCGELANFFVQPLSTSRGELGVTWRVDGIVAGTGDELKLDTNALALGAHAIDVEVRDPTSAVRRDPRDALVERRHWDLTVAVAPVAHREILGFPELSRCLGTSR